MLMGRRKLHMDPDVDPESLHVLGERIVVGVGEQYAITVKHELSPNESVGAKECIVFAKGTECAGLAVQLVDDVVPGRPTRTDQCDGHTLKVRCVRASEIEDPCCTDRALLELIDMV